jgi:dinuclear metal center YbgI/SA1388 family protein
MQLSEVVDRYDERLDTAAYAGVDASANGLQVGPDPADADPEIAHVAFAVDAAAATVEAALEAGADLLVTHHGVVWGGMDRLTGEEYRRIAPLIRGEAGLYVSHLPLDGHQELGNAAGVADVLELGDREPFAEIDGEAIGQRGTAPAPYAASELAETLATATEGDDDVQLLEFGPAELEKIEIVTGAGADFFDAAADAGVDAFVTGEGKQKLYHKARERGVTVALAGHYATETFGVRALQALADSWGLETTYLSHPTGL